MVNTASVYPNSSPVWSLLAPPSPPLWNASHTSASGEAFRPHEPTFIILQSGQSITIISRHCCTLHICTHYTCAYVQCTHVHMCTLHICTHYTCAFVQCTHVHMYALHICTDAHCTCACVYSKHMHRCKHMHMCTHAHMFTVQLVQYSLNHRIK